jgi:DNA-binding CsgD family transcriptional regulator
VPVQSSLAELALWLHRPADALAAARAGIELVGHGTALTLAPLLTFGLRACADLALLARAHRPAGPGEDWAAAGALLLESMRQRHAEIRGARPSLEAQSAAWSGTCEAEWTRLEGASDPTAWASAATAWEDLSLPYPAAYARYREAEALIAARDRAAASVALARSMAVASSLGARPLLEEAEALARRARLPIGEAADVEPGAHGDERARLGLTSRELEVLALVAAGRTNRQIGEQLFISEKTASVHVSNIMSKLGVAGRGEAAVVAHRLGLA